MPRYVIERDLPGAGSMSAEELAAVSQKSNASMNELAPDIQWVHSYVTDDRIYCVYIATDEERIREDARN